MRHIKYRICPPRNDLHNLFTDGELVKEAVLKAIDSFFEEFKIKEEIDLTINTLKSP